MSAARELWSFGDVTNLQPLTPSTSGDSDRGEDALKHLPAAKRRKLQKAAKAVARAPDLVVLLDDGDQKPGSGDDAIPAKGPVPAPQAHLLSALVTEAAAAQPAPPRPRPPDPLLEGERLRNQRLMEALRRSAQEAIVELADAIPEAPPCRDCPGASPSGRADSEAGGGGGRGPKILLKLRNKQGQETKVRIAPGEAFQRMFAGYRKHAVSQGWVGEDAKLIFLFDGDKLNPKTTPEEVDAEEDCVIDVAW